uniref:Coiled-coil domain-containing protein 39 n=1 Tax=Callorhinchus milii TaxID=7868 RepID=A0A4W3ITG7_CALMI
MEKEKIHLHNKLAEFKDRIHALTQHLKNVKQELNYTQSLQQAREKEIESETHFKILAEREIERLNQEMLRLENELVGLKERKNIMENNIFRSTQRIEGLKCQLNWDKQALEAWLEESARTDEDAITIEKYSQRDEGKIRVCFAFKALHRLAFYLQKSKIIIAQRERQDLIKQWQNTIEQMQKRDQDMDQCALQMAELKQQIREREAVIKEKAQFLKNEADNNNEFEKKISSSERQAAKLRSEYQTYETNRIQLENEVTLTHSKNIHDSLTQKLKDMTENLLSSEEQATRMEKMLKDEEKNMKYLGDLKFRKTEELTILENTEKTVLGQLSGNRATLRNLNSQITKLDHEALKQQEVIYNQDFQIMRLERKLAKLEGDLNSNEKDVLELRVAELTKNLEEKKMTKNLLEGQLKKLQNDLRHLVKHLDKGNEEKADLNHKIEDIHHYLDSSEKELKRKRFEKQELMIEDNLLKLSVKRLRDMLHHKADNVLSLEKRKLQLQTAMKERTEEIKLHMDMLHIQLKQTEQERQAISAELHERLSKIDKLKKRYELLMVSMAPPEGQEDRSQAYYVIKDLCRMSLISRCGVSSNSAVIRTFAIRVYSS